MGMMPSGKRFDYLIEESGWQEAIIVAIAAVDFPEIIASPMEFIALCNNDPETRIVKSEMTSDRGSNSTAAARSDGGACVIGRTTMTVVSFTGRSTASTITLGRSLRPSSRPASLS